MKAEGAGLPREHAVEGRSGQQGFGMERTFGQRFLRCFLGREKFLINSTRPERTRGMLDIVYQFLGL